MKLKTQKLNTVYFFIVYAFYFISFHVKIQSSMLASAGIPIQQWISRYPDLEMGLDPAREYTFDLH